MPQKFQWKIIIINIFMDIIIISIFVVVIIILVIVNISTTYYMRIATEKVPTVQYLTWISFKSVNYASNHLNYRIFGLVYEAIEFVEAVLWEEVFKGGWIWSFRTSSDTFDSTSHGRNGFELTRQFVLSVMFNAGWFWAIVIAETQQLSKCDLNQRWFSVKLLLRWETEEQ